MARPKRTSPALTKAEQREAGMRSISETLDLGNGLNLQNYSQKIQNLRSHLSRYNTSLAQVDDLTRKIKAIEADLNKTSEQMLLSIGGRYGKDSSEYGKAGGSPRGERRRRTATTIPTSIEEKNLEPVIPFSTNGKATIETNGNGKASVLQS
jgi:DNA repair ATPase RecN